MFDSINCPTNCHSKLYQFNSIQGYPLCTVAQQHLYALHILNDQAGCLIQFQLTSKTLEGGKLPFSWTTLCISLLTKLFLSKRCKGLRSPRSVGKGPATDLTTDLKHRMLAYLGVESIVKELPLPKSIEFGPGEFPSATPMSFHQMHRILDSKERENLRGKTPLNRSQPGGVFSRSHSSCMAPICRSQRLTSKA